jgi:hypothetical protein
MCILTSAVWAATQKTHLEEALTVFFKQKELNKKAVLQLGF